MNGCFQTESRFNGGKTIDTIRKEIFTIPFARGRCVPDFDLDSSTRIHLSDVCSVICLRSLLYESS